MQFAVQCVFLLGFLLSTQIMDVLAQPYLNLFNFTGWHNPGKDENPDEDYLFFNASVPLNINKYNLVILTPFTELRTLESSNCHTELDLDGNGLVTTWVKYNSDSSKNLVIGGVLHNYSDGYKFNENTWQIGGLFLYSLKLKTNLKVKPGIYYNKEFFGDYFVPLLGIDWRLNHNWNIFGIIPRYLVVEKKINDKLYAGARFRGMVTSYRLSESESSYVRVDDHHLNLFIESYLFNHLVFSLQPGISILRELNGRNTTPESDFKIDQSSLIMKAAIYYRFRTD